MKPNIKKVEAHSVTVVFSWKVIPGKEAEFTKWLHGIAQAAFRWPGHLGATTLKPPIGKGTYYSVVRFDTADHLKDWVDSDERNKWISQLSGIASVASSPQATGLETWFDISGPSIIPPPKWKMVLVTFVAVYPLSLILGEFVSPHIIHVNIFARALLFPVIAPAVLTYILMPFLTQRIFKRWLYKST